MKVQLIVVQGKPEGKTIPLLGPRFKIGRGETCHLRPNSELVSREHAEFVVGVDTVTVADLGSRNGTLVNGKAVSGPTALKDQDLVQVGPLTFAVSIQGAPAAATPAPAAKPSTPAPAAKPAAPAKGLDEVSDDDVDSWLFDENAPAAPGGDTITISAFRDGQKEGSKPAAAAPAGEENDEEYERLSNDEEDSENENANADDEESEDEEGSPDDMPEEFIDESNPFYVKKKSGEEPGKPAKPVYTDTSDAAKDILSKLLEKRRQSK